VIELGARHSLLSVPALARYLRSERPVALLAAKDRAIKAAIVARRLARVPTRIIGRLGTTVSAALEAEAAQATTLVREHAPVLPDTDRIVAVSQGADDIRRITGLRSSTCVVPTPYGLPC
jgi:hypothetical protein